LFFRDNVKHMSDIPKGARDRMRSPINPVYGQRILEGIFEFNTKHNFQALLDAHRAWLIMLVERAIVPAKQASPILRALDDIEAAGPDSLRPFDASVEFYYLHMERALVERVPDGEAVVGNLNLGRTRPEPLHRMVMRDALLRVLDHLLDTRQTLLDRADAEADTVMPGYTHLLHAQPTTLGHYLLAIHDHLARDAARLNAAYQTADQCTLGCGAMSGTSLPVDRDRVRELLGFQHLCENTIDSVSATDHVTESAGALATLMSLIGRLAQDLYVFSSQEFALIDVTDAFASPSSLMPQKKNALVLEYIRSRAARTIAALCGSFTVMHNVGYMDTEEVEIETYRPLFDAFALVEEALPTMHALLQVIEPDRQLMYRRTTSGFSSVTALAEAVLVREKLSYRVAHRIVARAVLLAVEAGKDTTGIDANVLNAAAHEMIGRPLSLDADAIAQALEPRSFIAHHAVNGGPAPAEVRRMAAHRRQQLGDERAAVTRRRNHLETARHQLRAAAANLAHGGSA
jgi:argininosuccinate lyase